MDPTKILQQKAQEAGMDPLAYYMRLTGADNPAYAWNTSNKANAQMGMSNPIMLAGILKQSGLMTQDQYQSYINSPSAPWTPLSQSVSMNTQPGASTNVPGDTSLPQNPVGSVNNPMPLTPTQPTNLTNTPPSATSATAQTGGTSPIINSQLSLGSKGADVTALQKFLGITADGNFGPQTQAAVKAWQAQNGLQADGNVGPQTMAKINSGTGTQTSQTGTQSVGLSPKPADDPSNQYNTDTGQPNPNYNSSSNNNSNSNTQNNSQITYQSTGNSQVDAALANMQTLIDNMSKTGQIPPGLQVTDAITSQFLQAAHQAVDPYTQQQIKSAVSDLNANLANQGTQFQNQQGQIVQDFGTALASEQNQAGGNGTAFGGQRAINELNMANSTNRSLASLGSQAAYNIGGALRTGAGQVGADNASQFNAPNLNLNTVGITGGQRGNVSNYGTLGYNYNPSQYTVGSLTDTGTQNVGNTYANYLSRYNQLAANQSNSGRTWQDLANQAITSGNKGSN